MNGRASRTERPVEEEAVSHIPRERRMYLKGLRIFARVAARSYEKRHGTTGQPPAVPGDSDQAGEEPRH